MQWLLYGPMTAAVAEALRRHEHTAHVPADVNLTPDSTPLEALEAARDRQYDILTSDAALVQAIYDSERWFKRSVVYLQLEGGEVEQDDAVDRLFDRYKRLAPGRLYTVTTSRVKVRQLPGPK